VRAFNPWPVAETRMDGEQLRVFEALVEGAGTAPSRIEPDRGKPAPDSREFEPDPREFASFECAGRATEVGTIVAVRDDAIVVQCGTGRLALRQVQRPGRRTVSAGDFARGGAASTHLLGKRLGG